LNLPGAEREDVRAVEQGPHDRTTAHHDAGAGLQIDVALLGRRTAGDDEGLVGCRDAIGADEHDEGDEPDDEARQDGTGDEEEIHGESFVGTVSAPSLSGRPSRSGRESVQNRHMTTPAAHPHPATATDCPPSDESCSASLMLDVAISLDDEDMLREKISDLVSTGEFPEFHPDEPEPTLDEAYDRLQQVIRLHDTAVTEVSDDLVAL